jgi:DNA-directed RNA polymerase subunit N (RpoN/RPB10)
MNPQYPGIYGIEVSKYSDAYPTLLRKAQECGVKVKSGQTLTFWLTDEQKEQIYQRLREVYASFEQDLLEGKIRVHIDRVGIDNPKLVVGISVKEYHGLKAWDIFYNLVDKLGMYRYCPGVVGEDITDKFVAEYKRRKGLQQPAPKQTVRCWECGREFSLEEARDLVKQGTAEWEVDGLFYCGC